MNAEGGRHQAQPQVVVILFGLRRMFSQRSQPGKAIVVVIDGGQAVVIRPDQPAFLTGEQEQKTVDQPQQLAVIIERCQPTGAQIIYQPDALRMNQKAIAERLECRLDAIAQPFPDAVALVECLPVVAFEPARGAVIDAERQAGAVTQPVKDTEIGEIVADEHRFQIEFDIWLAGEQRAIANQAQLKAVGHNAPDVIGMVQIFLQQRMGRQARTSGGRALVEIDAEALNMNRRGVCGCLAFLADRPVRNGEGLAFHHFSGGRVGQVITE